MRESLNLMLMLSLPVLGAALAIGLTVSLFQALTQIQEQTLSFVPKILGMGLIAVMVMPWIALKKFAVGSGFLVIYFSLSTFDFPLFE